MLAVILLVWDAAEGSRFVSHLLDGTFERLSERPFSLEDQKAARQQVRETSEALRAQFTEPLRPLPAFITSASINSDGLTKLPQLKGLHVTHCRVYCNWRYLTPQLTSLESFTVDELRQNTSWIKPYSATLSWDATDNQVQQLIAAGITPLIEIGEGTDHCLPTVDSSIPSKSGVADPGTVGEQQYLAYMYRYCRAVVHRYKSVVPIWQIENELNDSFLEALSGIRSPTAAEPENTPWGNFTYVSELLQTLYLAVKDEDASLWTTQNLLADTPQDAYEIAHIPEYYLDALRAWEPLMDMVSFDAYPNALVADPLYADYMSNITGQIRATLTNPQTPIMIAETGIHVMNYASLANVTSSAVEFSFQVQANYLTDVLQLTRSGIKGFQVFKLSSNDGFAAPVGGYSKQDIMFLQACTAAIVENTMHPLLAWTKSVRNVVYMASGRPILVLTAPTTSAYGILNASGNATASYNALQQIYAQLAH